MRTQWEDNNNKYLRMSHEKGGSNIEQQQQDIEKTHTGFFGDREGIAKPLIMNNKDYDRTDIWLDNDSSTLKSRLEDKVLTDSLD